MLHPIILSSLMYEHQINLQRNASYIVSARFDDTEHFKTIDLIDAAFSTLNQFVPSNFTVCTSYEIVRIKYLDSDRGRRGIAIDFVVDIR